MRLFISTTILGACWFIMSAGALQPLNEAKRTDFAENFALDRLPLAAKTQLFFKELNDVTVKAVAPIPPPPPSSTIAMSAVDKHDFSNLPREESSLDVDNLIVHGRWKVHKEWADVVGSYNKRPAIVFCFTQSDKKAEWMARNERRERRVLIDVKHEFTYRDYECIVGELASFSSTQS